MKTIIFLNDWNNIINLIDIFHSSNEFIDCLFYQLHRENLGGICLIGFFSDFLFQKSMVCSFYYMHSTLYLKFISIALFLF